MRSRGMYFSFIFGALLFLAPGLTVAQVGTSTAPFLFDHATSTDVVFVTAELIEKVDAYYTEEEIAKEQAKRRIVNNLELALKFYTLSEEWKGKDGWFLQVEIVNVLESLARGTLDATEDLLGRYEKRGLVEEDAAEDITAQLMHISDILEE